MHIKTVLVYHTEARAFSVNFVWMDPYMQCLSFNGVCAFNVTRMEAKFLTKREKRNFTPENVVVFQLKISL